MHDAFNGIISDFRCQLLPWNDSFKISLLMNDITISTMANQFYFKFIKTWSVSIILIIRNNSALRYTSTENKIRVACNSLIRDHFQCDTRDISKSRTACTSNSQSNQRLCHSHLLYSIKVRGVLGHYILGQKYLQLQSNSDYLLPHHTLQHSSPRVCQWNMILHIVPYNADLTE